MQPSTHQIKVMDWLGNNLDRSDAVVNAVAGSGKSTLLKLVAETISDSNLEIRDCLVLVFNRKNKESLAKKLGIRWKSSISTVHSAGYRVLRRYLAVKNLNLNQFKYRNLAKNLDWFDRNNPERAKVVSLGNFLKLADFVRQTLCPLTIEDLSALIDHYALDINKKYLADIGQRLQYLFQMGSDLAHQQAIVDHTDMLWLSYSWQLQNMPGFRFLQVLMVDEAQDMSRLQLEFVLTLVHRDGKALFVGDPAQSINGFCGADTNSFGNIKSRLQAQEFTLPVCYRCPTLHIDLINKLFEEIPIVPRDGAIPGSIEVIREHSLWHEDAHCSVKPGDLIIARCSSSLIDLHLKLITRGIASNLVGSSLKDDLLIVIEELIDRVGFDCQHFEKSCQSYLEFKTSFYEDSNNAEILLLQLQHNLKAIKSIHKHFKCKSSGDLCSAIENLFTSEDKNAVLLSTVHRAKGMENERVFIADPVTLPLFWENQKPWQLQQEQNLLYVALSRSTKELYLIGDAYWYDASNSFLKGLETEAETKAETGVGTDLVRASQSAECIISEASVEDLNSLIRLAKQEQGNRIADRFWQYFLNTDD